MDEKKNQHYIPQFFLKNFSQRKGIAMYRLSNNYFIDNTSIKKECSKDYFYSTNLKYENNLQDIEGYASKVIREIISTNKLWEQHSENKGTLLMFLMLQIYRTEKSTEELNEYVNEVGKGILYNEKFSGNLDIGYDEIENFEFSYNEPGVEMIKNALKGMHHMYDMDYALLINQTDIQFIFGESPAIKYNKYFNDIDEISVGIACKGLITIMPISPYLTILFYDSKLYISNKDEKHRIYISNSRDINELNALQYLNTKDRLYAESTEALRKFVDTNNLEDLNKFKPKLEKTIIEQADSSAYVAIKYPQIKFPMKMEYLPSIKEKVNYGDGIRNHLLVAINELMNLLERNSDKDFRVILKGFSMLMKIISQAIPTNLIIQKALIFISELIFKELKCTNENELEIIMNRLKTHLLI